MGPTKVLISLILVHMVKNSITWGNDTKTFVEINRPMTATFFTTESIQSSVPDLKIIGSDTSNQKTIDAAQNGSMHTKHANNIKTGNGRRFVSKASDLQRNQRFQKIVSMSKVLSIGNLTIAGIGK